MLRALELPATYTALLASSSDYLGAVAKPESAVAYFETDPVKPTSTLTVKFDASFARADDGETDGLKYYWDFGDGTTATGTTVLPHLHVLQWADVKLVVARATTQRRGACTGRRSQ